MPVSDLSSPKLARKDTFYSVPTLACYRGIPQRIDTVSCKHNVTNW